MLKRKKQLVATKGVLLTYLDMETLNTKNLNTFEGKLKFTFLTISQKHRNFIYAVLSWKGRVGVIFITKYRKLVFDGVIKLQRTILCLFVCVCVCFVFVCLFVCLFFFHQFSLEIFDLRVEFFSIVD